MLGFSTEALSEEKSSHMQGSNILGISWDKKHFPYGEVIKFGNASFPFGYHLKEVMRNHVRTFSQKFGLHEDQLKQSDISPCTHPLLQQYLIICVDELENQAVWLIIFNDCHFLCQRPLQSLQINMAST